MNTPVTVVKFNMGHDEEYKDVQDDFQSLIDIGDVSFYSVNTFSLGSQNLPQIVLDKAKSVKSPMVWIKGGQFEKELAWWVESTVRYAVECALPRREVTSYANIKPGAVLSSDNEDDIGEVSLSDSNDFIPMDELEEFLPPEGK